MGRKNHVLKKCSLLQTLRARARTRKPRPTSLRANKRSQKEAKKAATMAMKLNNGDISIHNNQVKEVFFFFFFFSRNKNECFHALYLLLFKESKHSFFVYKKAWENIGPRKEAFNPFRGLKRPFESNHEIRNSLSGPF